MRMDLVSAHTVAESPCSLQLTKGGLSQLFTHKFGIEIEFTGITRREAAIVVANYFDIPDPEDYVGDSDDYYVCAPDDRIWKFVYDGSIRCERKEKGRRVPVNNANYSVEMVSPILKYYEDIRTLQDIVRRLRKAGGFANSSCGIHIHLDGTEHTPRSILNFINLVASRNDLFYKALQIKADRMSYCKKMDSWLVRNANNVHPLTFNRLKTVWYEGYSGSVQYHYHQSRYHFLNLHSFFTGNHTVELRGFNSELHAGKVRAYVVFALALNNQALTQKYARYRKVQEENEKFAMRVYLNRIGLIGEEFKTCRTHLYEHLDGNAAWRYGSRENCRSHRKKKNSNEENTEGVTVNEEANPRGEESRSIEMDEDPESPS